MTNKQKDPTPIPTPEPRRLIRSTDDRILAGVASGLGSYLRIDPVLVRVGFAVSLLFGGLGFFAYLALAIFTPADDGSRYLEFLTNGGTGGRAARIARGLAIVTLVVIALALACAVAVASAWTVFSGHGTIAAAVVIVLGVILVAGAFAGGGTRWLALPALLIAIPAGAAAASGIDIDDSMGVREYRPPSAAAIPKDGYELGIGQLIVDLRDTVWNRNGTVHLQARLGFGQMVVSVPANVCVIGDANGTAGELYVRGDRSEGFRPSVASGPPRAPRGTPTLIVNADIEAGQLVVTDRPPQDFSGDRKGFDHGRSTQDDERERSAARAACGA